MSLVHWKPRDLETTFSWDPFFDRFFDLVKEAPAAGLNPALDLMEEKDCLIATVELPGVEPRNVEVNLQGDLPTLEPRLVRACLAPLADEGPDIATLAAEIVEPDEVTNPNVVKVVGTPLAEGRLLRALYFTRATAPYGEGALYHHIGIYAYRRPALERFVGLPPSALERREKLEQLRALEAGMRIDVEIVDTVPLGVDTPADLERARRLLETAEPPAS